MENAPAVCLNWPPPVPELTLLAPAKLNLFLAVTGRRGDGFHDLVSLVAPLDFGDRLTCTLGPGSDVGGFALACSDPEVPVDGSNLVLKAAQAFAHATGWNGRASFVLEKRIPMGAGLGGGSSDAVAALRALNTLVGSPLATEALGRLAAQLGSDCPLFLANAPVTMRGRGERISPVEASVAAGLKGRHVLVFKPPFGIATPWAYGAMIARPETYMPVAEAEARLADLMRGIETGTDFTDRLCNNMERVAFEKYLAMPALLGRLQRHFGLQPRMSGSGSACFAFLRESDDVPALVRAIRNAWGESTFAIPARLV